MNSKSRLTRREWIGTTTALATASLLPSLAGEEPASRSRLGLVIYCRQHLRRKLREEDPAHDLYEPRRFLEHCRAKGYGGLQIALGERDPAWCEAYREELEAAELVLEAIIHTPVDRESIPRFTRQMETASRCGARAVRTVIIPGRRYERFDSLEEFRRFEARGQKRLELATPVAEKLRLPLAVENHKDQRLDERLALFEHIDSEYVGACVDTGNSFALLDDPVEVAGALAPWAHAVHLKDQAVKECEEGFLLADIPLGQGCLDLKAMVSRLREKRPDIHFNLELITRDPLLVPCLQPSYWAPMPRDLPARDLARTLEHVRRRAREDLPLVDELSPAERVKLEDEHVRESVRYFDRHLAAR